MGLFKGVKDMLWVDTPKKDEPVDNTQSVPTPEPQKKPAYQYMDSSVHNDPVYTPINSTSPDSSTNQSDLGIARKHFDDVLAKNNQPGNDYYEFITAKNGMDELPNEEKRYTIIYKGFSAAGLTKDTILKSANFYLTVIDNDIQKIQSSFDTKFKTDVSDNKQKIDQKSELIKSLTAQITSLTAEVKQLQDAVSENELKLNSIKNAYLVAGNEAKNTITTEIQKITQYIS